MCVLPNYLSMERGPVSNKDKPYPKLHFVVITNCCLISTCMIYVTTHEALRGYKYEHPGGQIKVNNHEGLSLLPDMVDMVAGYRMYVCRVCLCVA